MKSLEIIYPELITSQFVYRCYRERGEGEGERAGEVTEDPMGGDRNLVVATVC